MSQHLFAVDRLADGVSERLISEGYPLGPHALVVALSKLGPNTVHAFDGLAIAVAVATCLAALALLEQLAPWRRIAGALVVGFAYLLAVELRPGRLQGVARGAVRARVRDRARGARALTGPRWRERVHDTHSRHLDGWAAVPLAVLAIGAVYCVQLSGAALDRRDARRLGAVRDCRAVRRPSRGSLRAVGARRRPRRRGFATRARADRRLRELRDLRPGQRRARQPLRPALAARGARDLAVGRFPRRARRRRGAGDRLLPRRRDRRRGARLGDPRLVAARRPGAAGRARRGAPSSGSTRSSPAPPTRRRRRW